MPQTKIKKILLLGSGGIRIGQAGEFDYSGSQAIKALKEEGIKVILVNPNIATIQTDPGMADVLYLQPLTETSVTQIIAKERPDAVLLGFGGQTALNLGLALEKSGVFAKYQVAVLGTSVTSIRLSEDRSLFKQELDTIDVNTAKSMGVDSVDAALAVADDIGYPVMMRAAFSLGGLSSGIVHDAKTLAVRVKQALTLSPQILIEENLIGWSEFEYEIVRDQAGNALTICNMENIDPMGIHTGESIVVCPSQSLDNNEYHMLRDVALKVAHHFEIIGECNIQYAYHMKTKTYRVIEINPRLSRSSALASKATGYPLAYIAAKLALGHKLYELKNSVTQKTCAFFEPALDYVVVKMPRWDTHKLKGADRQIGTEMKSVGEVMAIGRSFPEALQKAVSSLNIGAEDLASYPHTIKELEQDIHYATDRRIFALFQYFQQGGDRQTAHKLSGIDLFFLHHLESMAQLHAALAKTPLTTQLMLDAKQAGFADSTIAQQQNKTTEEIRAWRIAHRITPKVRQIDTLAGEFDASTNYLYLSYYAQDHDIQPSVKPAIIVLGSGPYSIGSSVEFDWCAVTTARSLKKLGEHSIIINANPETVSTDYDESDRLYFEPLTFERVQDIADFENLKAIIVAMGGQVANNLVEGLHAQHYPILGTHADHIALAENRAAFSSLLSDMNIDQPDWTSVDTLENATAFADNVGYPVLIRPSYVLSGSAMNVVTSEEALSGYLNEATVVSPKHPVVLSDFIQEAKELDIDGVAEKGKVVIYAISEHVENAGVHSGDATIVLPPQRLYLETIRRAKHISKQIVKALKISGPFNIQFIAKDNALKVIECNLRASRSFPFVSKVTGYNFIEIATQVMLGRYQHTQDYNTLDLDYVGVKSPQFSYQRLKGSNPVAHVEMASTGEVACLGDDLHDAFYRSWQATDNHINGKTLLLSISADKKPRMLASIQMLSEQGYQFYATKHTHHFLAEHGVATTLVYKAQETKQPNITTIIKERQVDCIINIPSAMASSTEKTDGFTLRRLAIEHNIPLFTNMQRALLMAACLNRMKQSVTTVKSWQDFFSDEHTNA